MDTCARLDVCLTNNCTLNQLRLGHQQSSTKKEFIKIKLFNDNLFSRCPTTTHTPTLLPLNPFLLVHKPVHIRQQMPSHSQTLVLVDEVSDNLACQVQLLNWQPHILPGHQHFAFSFAISLLETFMDNLHDGFTFILLDDVLNLIFGEPGVGIVHEVFHYA
jgi:hypothetical protein